MSSYLSFFVVPKSSITTCKGGKEEVVKLVQEPLMFLCYNNSSDIYRHYYHVLNPAYAGEEDKYTEITELDAKKVVDYFVEDILNPFKKRLQTLYKIITQSFDPELAEDILDLESELEDLEGTYTRLKYIQSFIEEVLSYSDFEKVLINID